MCRMYASLRTYRAAPGQIETLMHRVDRDFVEALCQEPGFIDYQALRTGDDVIMTISMFRTEAQALASNSLAAEWVAEALADIEVMPIGVIAGEVMVSRAAAEMLEPAHA